MCFLARLKKSCWGSSHKLYPLYFLGLVLLSFWSTVNKAKNGKKKEKKKRKKKRRGGGGGAGGQTNVCMVILSVWFSSNYSKSFHISDIRLIV